MGEAAHRVREGMERRCLRGERAWVGRADETDGRQEQAET